MNWDAAILLQKGQSVISARLAEQPVSFRQEVAIRLLQRRPRDEYPLVLESLQPVNEHWPVSLLENVLPVVHSESRMLLAGSADRAPFRSWCFHPGWRHCIACYPSPHGKRVSPNRHTSAGLIGSGFCPSLRVRNLHHQAVESGQNAFRELTCTMLSLQSSGMTSDVTPVFYYLPEDASAGRSSARHGTEA